MQIIKHSPLPFQGMAMRHYRLYLRHIKGFTLIEIILVIALLAIISAVAVKFYVQQLVAVQTAQNTSDALWQARLAMQRMVTDIGYIQSTSAITTNTSTNLVFTDVTGSSFNYQLSGSSLLCNSQVLANGVNSLTFTYYDKTGAVTATVANIRYIQIALTITKNNTNFSLTTSVYLRELIS
jgi:prepilin-type N-terminal cleavage/methylation domain-containing protein